MIQPYPDGVSSRRTSAMAGLSHGLPIITTTGHNTESFWAESRAVALAPAGDVRSLARLTDLLLADADERGRLKKAAGILYDERFQVKRTVTALREATTS
jgi:hypothetical protein